MQFASWFLNNFGLFFGAIFLIYIYLMISRLTIIYDYLRSVSMGDESYQEEVGERDSLNFLKPFFRRLKRSATAGRESVIEAIWSEFEGRIGIHFSALNGYVNALILIGFAGTIFGSIGAFNEMFTGLARGETATVVFAAAWNSGLATALYTSLGAGVIGALVVTILYSRYLMTRMKRLETLVGLRISEITNEVSGAHNSRVKLQRIAANVASPSPTGDTPQEYFLASLTAQLSPSRAKARPGGMSPHRDNSRAAPE